MIFTEQSIKNLNSFRTNTFSAKMLCAKFINFMFPVAELNHRNISLRGDIDEQCSLDLEYSPSKNFSPRMNPRANYDYKIQIWHDKIWSPLFTIYLDPYDDGSLDPFLVALEDMTDDGKKYMERYWHVL